MSLLAAGLVGLALAGSDGLFESAAVLLVATATLLALVGLARRHDARERGAEVGLLGLACVAVGAAALTPGELYASGPARAVSRGLAAGAAAIVLAAAVAVVAGRRRVATRLAVAGGGAAVGALVAMVVASPRPRIDVCFMYQAASRALLHGHNPYLAHWTSGIRGEVSGQFTYLPGSAVLLAPFHAVFGDVRYGLVAALVVTAWFVSRLGGRWAPVLAAAVLVFPGATFATEQAWNDPLLMAALAGTVYATRRGRTGWAVVSLAVALTCKQYAFLFVPLAAAWAPFGWRRALRATAAAAAFVAPWALAAPGAFYDGVVRYNLDLPPRLDSLSLYAVAVRHGVVPGMLVVTVATGAALVLAARRVRSDPRLFATAAGVVMAVYDLANKQSFFNEWELAAVLLVIGAACCAVQPAPEGLPVSAVP
ncbi:MAG TPA: glycosyltransferase 87 family protein [Acidimicrobiales bacterium]|nr:glycosyltransferase 87 family protein [Acidimicrobiales bacterium]